MKISYLTSNVKKFDEAKIILHGWTLERLPIELQEIQGTAQEIVRYKALEGLKITSCPFIVEDVSAYFSGLGGLPGPYIKDFVKALGAEKMYDVISHTNDLRITVTCNVAYARPGHEPLIFEGVVHGKVVPPRGEYKHGFNSIFLQEGHSKTYGELTIEERACVSMRYLALTQLRNHLSSTLTTL